MSENESNFTADELHEQSTVTQASMSVTDRLVVAPMTPRHLEINPVQLANVS